MVITVCDNTIPTSLFIWNKFFSLTIAKKKKKSTFYRHNSVTLVVIDLVLVPNHREQCIGMVVSLQGVNFTSQQAFKGWNIGSRFLSISLKC